MKKNNLIYGLILIVLGILLMLFNGKIVSIILAISGLLLTGFGVLDIVNKAYPYGITKIIVGIAIILFGSLLVEMCFVIIGVLLVIYGAERIYNNYKLTKNAALKDKILFLINPIIMIAIGVLFIIARWKVADVIFIIIGAIVTVLGVTFLFEKDDNNFIEKKDDDIYVD